MPSNNPNHMDNLNPPWQKGQSGNPRGRPRKLFSDLAKELKEQGYENVTPSRLVEAYEMLIGLPASKLKEIMQDEDQPVVFKILIKGLTSSKGVDVLERILDRAHGKARQIVEIDNLREKVQALFPFGETKDNLNTDGNEQDNT